MNPPCFAWHELRLKQPPPAPRGALARFDRDALGRPYVDDWVELLAFAFAVTNATVESHTLRQIYGPYRIDEITIAQSATDGRNMHIYLATDEDNAEPTATITLAPRVPRQYQTDTASLTPSVPALVAPTHLRPRYTSLRGLSRISIVAENNQAAPQSVWGTITVVHLLPLDISRY